MPALELPPPEQAANRLTKPLQKPIPTINPTIAPATPDLIQPVLPLHALQLGEASGNKAP
jgi:hypothetical protein